MSKTLAMAIGAGLLILASSAGFAQETRVVVGRIAVLSVDDPTDTKGLSRDESRYVVRVELDSIPNIVLGFGEKGKGITAQLAMLDMLKLAMEHGWQVALRLDRDLSAGSQRSYATIVSVSVKP